MKPEESNKLIHQSNLKILKSLIYDDQRRAWKIDNQYFKEIQIIGTIISDMIISLQLIYLIK